MKRVLTILLVAAVLAVLFPMTVSAATQDTSGKCGDNITWEYDRKSQTLRLSGTGSMYDYSESNPAPWTEHLVTRYYIGEGITRIGNHAFPGGGGTNFIRIPASVTEIGSKAMAGGSVQLVFYGSAPTIAPDAFAQAYGLCCYYAGWEGVDFASYGEKLTWEQFQVRLNPSTKAIYRLNTQILPSHFLLDVYSPNQNNVIETFTPQMLELGAYNTRTTGWKQLQLSWNGAQLTHDYLVTDGQSHFDTVQVTVPAYQYYANRERCPIPTVTSGPVQLKQNLHYSVSYYDNVRMGSDAKVVITGLGEWVGLSKTVTFRILKQDISTREVYPYDQPFAGAPLDPYYTPTNFERGTDYIFLVKNNINIGTARFRMVGIGDYFGSTTGSFQITDGSSQVTTLEGAYNGDAGGTLNDEIYYDERIIAPGIFHGQINSTINHTRYDHYAYYELYRLEGEETVFITSYESPLGKDSETEFTYDFSHIYDSATEEGGEVYILAYSWVNTRARVYSGVCVLLIPAKVPPATGMMVAKLADSGDFRREYFNAYGTDGTLGDVTWISADPSVALIEDGVATLVAPGTTTVTAQCGELSASVELTVPVRSIADCDLLGFDPETGMPILCCNQILLEAGIDYRLEISQQDGLELLTVTGMGLFSGTREFLLDYGEEVHTHSYDGCLDALCDFCGTRRPAGHNLPEQWHYDEQHHWQICLDCGAADGYAEHTTVHPDHLHCAVCKCPFYVPGDINGDNTVNNKDALMLMQYLAGWDVNLSIAPTDINGDGTTNNKDALMLMQYLAGWDVKLH